MNSTLAARRIAVAGVWLHQGLWCKVLGRDPSHLGVVAQAPGMRHRAIAATRAIGVLEVGLAVWILAGRLPRAAAVAQSVAVVAMNGGGLRWGGAEIKRPAMLLGRNALFLGLVWLAALGGSRR